MVTIIVGVLVGSIAYHLNVDGTMLMGVPSYQVSWVSVGLGAFVGALVMKTLSTTRSTANVALTLYVGIILAIVLRMIVDVVTASKDHNLFPLELIVYSALTIPTAFMGASVGHAVSLRRE